MDRDTRLDSFEAEHAKSLQDQYQKKSGKGKQIMVTHGTNGLNVHEIDPATGDSKVIAQKKYWQQTAEGQKWLQNNPDKDYKEFDRQVGHGIGNTILGGAAGAVAGGLAGIRTTPVYKDDFFKDPLFRSVNRGIAGAAIGTVAGATAGGAGTAFYYRMRNGKKQRVKNVHAKIQGMHPNVSRKLGR